MRSLLYIVCLLPAICTAQELVPIQLDRPDQTECPFIVPQGYFQAELGALAEQTDKQTRTFFHPAALFKFGISGRTELRLITETTTISFNDSSISGLTPVTAGFKVNLANEKGILPEISFIGHLTIPQLATKEFRSVYYAPSFRFTLQHTLGDRFSIGYNLGAEWDGTTPNPSFIYTLTSGVSLNKKFGAYLEAYGFILQKGPADHRFDAGITFLINDNMMADISGGKGMTPEFTGYYLALGFSFRVGKTRG